MMDAIRQRIKDEYNAGFPKHDPITCRDISHERWDGLHELGDPIDDVFKCQGCGCLCHTALELQEAKGA